MGLVDTLCSKNEHSLNSTKTVKNLCLIAMKRHLLYNFNLPPTAAFHPEKKKCQRIIYHLNEFTEKNIKFVTYRKNIMFQ